MHLPASAHRRTRRGVRERSTQQAGTSQPASSTSWPADPRMVITRSRVHPSAETNRCHLCAGQDAIPKEPISRLDTCECELSCWRVTHATYGGREPSFPASRPNRRENVAAITLATPSPERWGLSWAPRQEQPEWAPCAPCCRGPRGTIAA